MDCNARGNATLLLLCLLFSTLAVPQSVPSSSQEIPTDPESTLAESYQLSSELVPFEQAILLNSLCRVAGEHNLRHASAWSEENFRLASRLPLSWNKLAIQKNALVALSYSNPGRAIVLLRSMELPVPLGGARFPEDVRSDGARTIFRNYWVARGTKGLPTIRRTAAYLGETGQYPYLAIEGIFKEVVSKSRSASTQLPENASSLLLDAYSSYRRGSKFESEDRDFVHLIQATHATLPPALLREGLQMGVDRLLRPDAGGESLPYVSRITTDQGSATFRKRQDALLFGLLPLVREVDPEWAARIVQKNQVLAQAGSNTGKVTTQGSVTGLQPEQQRYAHEQILVESVGDLAREDPEGALRLTKTISDPTLQTLALANIASALGQSAPNRTNEVEETIRQIVPGIKDANDRLSALSALARSAAAARDEAGFRDALNRSFVLGEELFDEDMDAHPGMPTYQTSSYDALIEVTKSGVSILPTTTLARVRQVENVALKAYLLAGYAEAAYAAQSNGNPRLDKK